MQSDKTLILGLGNDILSDDRIEFIIRKLRERGVARNAMRELVAAAFRRPQQLVRLISIALPPFGTGPHCQTLVPH